MAFFLQLDLRRRAASHLDSASKFYGYHHSLDGATLFLKTDSNELRINVHDKITLIFAKFGAYSINTSSKVALHVGPSLTLFLCT